ncbi:hypothetical protein THOD04_50327 [Vibrio owensii]|nr:hypothetical protein THOD04_50327 [Vibrio owensii]
MLKLNEYNTEPTANTNVEIIMIHFPFHNSVNNSRKSISSLELFEREEEYAR